MNRRSTHERRPAEYSDGCGIAFAFGLTLLAAALAAVLLMTTIGAQR